MSACLRPVLVLLLCACSSPGDAPDEGTPGDLSSGPGQPPDLNLPADGEAMQVGGEGDLMAGAPRLRITMVDVGQGDGLLVRFPNGKVLALDSGPDRDKTLGYGAYLSAQGISGLDYVVLSHAHADHYNGMPFVLSLLPDDKMPRVFDPGYDRMTVTGYPAFRMTAGARYMPVKDGDSLPLDPLVEVQVLSGKSMPASDGSDDVNNSSTVLRMRYHNFSMLFEGDAETDAEQGMVMERGAALHSTVVKLGHHGSCNATGTTFLTTTHPQYALLSASTGNTFGHPHCQTINKLKATPVHWLRTDMNGTISVVTDGVRFAVSFAKGNENDVKCPRNCANPTDF